MYGHTFAQALTRLGGDELRVFYVLCCDTAVQELLVSKIRDWIKREPERFARKLEEKAVAYRDWSDDDLRLGILLELAKRAKLVGMPLTTAAELEEFAGGIVEHIEIGVAEEDRNYQTYREDHPETSELEALIDYQIVQLMQALGRLLDAAPQQDWEIYMRRVESLLPDLPELWEAPPEDHSDTELDTPPQGIAESPEAASREHSPHNDPFLSGQIDHRTAAREVGEEDFGRIAEPGWENASPPHSESASLLDLDPDAPIGSVRLEKGSTERREDTFDGPVEPGLDAASGPASASERLHADGAAEPTEPAAPVEPPRPNGAKILLAALEQQQGFGYYEAAMTLLASAKGLLGLGETSELYGRRIDFLTVSASPAFLQVIPGGAKGAPLSAYRNLNPQRRRLPLLLTQLFLPELVSEDELEADYEPLLALWRSHANEYGTLRAELEEENNRIDYYTRESASCAEQLEAAQTERNGSEQRITEIRSSLVDKLRVSSMQLPHISASFDQLLEEYAENRRRMSDTESSRQERGQGFTGLVKYTLNYAASSVTLIDLRRKQDRILERMADEALHSDGEWGQGERYVVAAERERIGFLDTEISRLTKLQAEYREELRRSEQACKGLEQDKKKLEKKVYGLADLEQA
ncbi:hypothetical protein [Saccharibacillus sacchari]|uniref:Uncharacterized protein n=1 Tax=Saccharibacillus sacchari TaxID=456493 RepID=A0ACC6PC52_9BACL